MRIFILKSNSACLDNINVRSPASSGRFDVVLDFVLECLFDRDGPRQDVKIVVVLDGCSPCRVLEFSSNIVKSKLENERALLDLILQSKVPVRQETFEDLLRRLRSEGFHLVCLYEEGEPLRLEEVSCRNTAFIIGDQDGFTSRDIETMRKLGVKFVSIGPISYLSWFCCVYINYLLDVHCRDV